jgi:hypothetical protein
MLKIYVINGKQYQFEEGTQPSGAEELKKVKPSEKVAEPVKAEEPEAKAETPANKSRKPSNKAGKAGGK